MATKAGIDHFTKQQFEDALPRRKGTTQPMCRCAGLLDGEYTYIMPVCGEESKVAIEIRSSIGTGGVSADTGENSIRAWLVWFDSDAKSWKPLGSKTQKYVTRLPGWQDRLASMLRTLYGWRLKAGNCPTCGKPKGIFKVTKAGANHGRVFAKCQEHNGFSWLEEDKDGTKA